MAAEHLVKPWKLPPQSTYVFRNANVVDPVSGSILKERTVKIAGGYVESVDDADYIVIPKNNASMGEVIEVDLKGKYLCPGLIDSHLHLREPPGEKDLRDTHGMPLDVSFMRQPYYCKQILSRGFTTVRDCGGASLALKEAIQEGVVQGPRLFIAGHALTQTGGHADLRGSYDHTDSCGSATTGIGRVCDGVKECTQAARDELRQGADFIKIMTGGGVASPTDTLESVQFLDEEVQAICAVARNRDTYVTAHAYTPASILHAINNGVSGIEHGNLLDNRTAQIMASKGIFLTPTLVTYSAMTSPDFPGFLPPESAAKNQRVLDAGVQSLQVAARAGVTMCYGTDLLGPLSAAQTHEFALRSQVLSAVEILRSATVNPAKMLRQPKLLGQVREGFFADMLILNENPLDDVKILDRPAQHLLAVIKEGRVCVSRWSQLPQDAVAAPPNLE